MTDRELMQMALDALESSRVFVTSREKIKHPEGTEWYDERIEALRARLAQPEQEPVAWVECDGQLVWNNREAAIGRNLYTAPPQREWQGLTNEEIMDACSAVWASHPIEVGRVVEEKLKEKNYDKP